MRARAIITILWFLFPLIRGAIYKKSVSSLKTCLLPSVKKKEEKNRNPADLHLFPPSPAQSYFPIQKKSSLELVIEESRFITHHPPVSGVLTAVAMGLQKWHPASPGYAYVQWTKKQQHIMSSSHEPVTEWH